MSREAAKLEPWGFTQKLQQCLRGAGVKEMAQCLLGIVLSLKKTEAVEVFLEKVVSSLRTCRGATRKGNKHPLKAQPSSRAIEKTNPVEQRKTERTMFNRVSCRKKQVWL